jgi:hypothetical protein
MDIIYILTNEAMPGIIKIGYTTEGRLNQRIKELFSTGVPLAFECYYACLVENGFETEQIIHKLFQEDRINPKREFFTSDPEKVKLALSLLKPQEITPKENEYLSTEEINDIQKINKRKNSKFTFSAVDIEIGSQLYFSRDNNINCTVASDNTVIYEGEEITLTEAARNTGLIPYYELQGPRFWMFENETLVNRRKRYETI